MKQLYLVRSTRHRIPDHGKLSDYHHPLTRRGELAAISIGKHMARKAYMPELVICASPTRTRQTLSHIWPLLHPTPELIHDFRIHLSRGEAMLERLQQIDKKFSRVLMISIAPGISDLARVLNQPDAAASDAFADGLPPGAMAVFDCAIPAWSDIGPTQGRLVEIAIGGIF